jgi:hypothetical protein
MGILGWLKGNWGELLQTTSILVGFFVTAYNLRADTNERKIQNLLTLTSAHRDIWSKLYEKPQLARILNDEVDLAKSPASIEEELIVHLAILHLSASFKARRFGMEFNDDRVAEDIRQFFILPIPRSVWQRSKQFQSSDFVAFVDSYL